MSKDNATAVIDDHGLDAYPMRERVAHVIYMRSRTLRKETGRSTEYAPSYQLCLEYADAAIEACGDLVAALARRR